MTTQQDLVNFICARCYDSFLKEASQESLDDAKRAEYSTEENLGVICGSCHKEIKELKANGLWPCNSPTT